MKYNVALGTLSLVLVLQGAAVAAQHPPKPAQYDSRANSAASADTLSTPATNRARPDSSAMPAAPIKIIYHDQVGVPADRLFRSLESKFAGGWLGPYQVVRSDPRTRTLVVRRDLIDGDNWSKWTYCNVGPLDMLDSLRDGTVTITIKLEPAGRTTLTTVSADFEGTYGLASSSKSVRCVSRGVLEEGILATMAQEEQQWPNRVARR